MKVVVVNIFVAWMRLAQGWPGQRASRAPFHVWVTGLLLFFVLSFSNKREMKGRGRGEQCIRRTWLKPTIPSAFLWARFEGKVTRSGSLEDQSKEKKSCKHTSHTLYCEVMEKRGLQKTERQLQEDQLQESKKHCSFLSRTGIIASLWQRQLLPMPNFPPPMGFLQKAHLFAPQNISCYCCL